MIVRILLLCLALNPFVSSLKAGMWDNVTNYFTAKQKSEPPSIRVLILHDADGAQLEVKGKYSLFDPYTNSETGKTEHYIGKRFAGKSRYIQAYGDGLKWGEAFPGTYQLKIKPEESSTVTLVNQHAYEGLIFIYDIGGTISIVNEILIEDYVNTLLDSYQDQQLEPETWAALAIVLRTNAYNQASHPKKTLWAIDAEKVGYKGFISDHVVEYDAVRFTRYMIMSRTGIYEGLTTPFAAQFEPLTAGQSKSIEVSKISLAEANEMAKKGEHAAQILAKAFPNTTIMLMKYAK